MEISLTISYHVTIDKDEFWDSETGKLNSKIECQFEKIFPEKIKLSDKDTTKRNHISYYPLHEGKNCLRCAFCGKWLYIPDKEYMAEGLDYCRIINEKPYCHSCAWELEADIRGDSKE